MHLRKLPIGIQDFVSIRQENYLYVDKTALMYRLVNEGRSYFLSRPRRFGKSLLLSAIGAYLEGKKNLFTGLALENLEMDWFIYPVLRLDLNAELYNSRDSLEGILDSHLKIWEQQYGQSGERSLSRRFLAVIKRAHEASGKRVAVLIDEYDKPLLQTMENNSLHEQYKLILKTFYGVLKSADAHLKFAFITGVTKFSQISVFSDLNHLIDLTLHPDYATICGITEDELTVCFKPELESLAQSQNVTFESCLEKTRWWYNGYKFEENAKKVYNPFSTLNLLSRKKYESYWFATGTPSFLVELLKNSSYDLRELEGIQLAAEEFSDYRAEADQPIPVIYQSGYLTISDYNPARRIYTLCYPNAEVRYGFLNFISSAYLPINPVKTGSYIGKFADEIESGQPELFLDRLKSFFAGIPYELNDKSERYYQTVFYLVFKLLGQFVETEVRSCKGRADAVVSCRDYVYVFEFKLFGSAEEAGKQIDEKGYLIPYTGEGKTLFKIGVEFNQTERNIGKWIIGKVPRS